MYYSGAVQQAFYRIWSTQHLSLMYQDTKTISTTLRPILSVSYIIIFLYIREMLQDNKNYVFRRCNTRCQDV